jgi:hypothetical protein
MAISEIEHLSIFINANQINRIKNVNQMGWVSNSAILLVLQHVLPHMFTEAVFLDLCNPSMNEL